MNEMRHEAWDEGAEPMERAGWGLSDSDLIGRRIGDFHLLDILGRGGMGTVYLARHSETEQRVAIKVIAPHIADHPQVCARFEAEARAVTRIDHPNVIKIFDFGVLVDGTPFHVMELAEGRELQEVLEERPQLTAEEAAPFVEQICQGLQAAHDSGVVHRDLKPENIIILRERPLSLKILDFGIAKLLDPGDWVKLTVTGMVLGTPLFIAPEQALGERAHVGPKTDIYSLGVLLYMMLCGEPPFEAEALGLLLAQHIKDPPPPLLERQPDLPAAVARLVHRCLEKDPEERPASARELSEAYMTALGASPTRALDGQDTIHDTDLPASLPPPPLEPLTPPPILSPSATSHKSSSRNMLAIAVAGGAILLICLLLALTAQLLSAS